MSETNSAVAIMNQVPGSDAGVRGESPLHHVGLEGIADTPDADAGVLFSEAATLLEHNQPDCAACSAIFIASTGTKDFESKVQSKSLYSLGGFH